MFWHRIRHLPAVVRIVAVLAVVSLVASPLVIPLYRFEYAATSGKSVIWAPVCLFAVFAISLPVWIRRVHRQKHPWLVLGMAWPHRWLNAWAIAFLTGTAGVIVLYAIQFTLGWVSWQSPSGTPVVRNLVEGLLVGIGVGLVEELLFRGWLLFELEQDYSPPVSLWLNAAIFAIAHYLRPFSEILATWPQFAGLMLLGLMLGWARRIPHRQGAAGNPVTTLGYAAGLHGGLVWAYYQVDVNDLLLTTERVPAWITGVGGNPLAGVLGLGVLGVLAGYAYIASHRPSTR